MQHTYHILTTFQQTRSTGKAGARKYTYKNRKHQNRNHKFEGRNQGAC